MLITLLKLFYNFFYVGAFAFGGGYAMIPMLQRIVAEQGWLTAGQFTDMIAISQMTPGPIAINMATYIGYQSAGVFGSLTATIAVCLPSFILVTFLIRSILKYEKHPIVMMVLRVLRPAVAGLIASAAFVIAMNSALVNVDAYKASGQVLSLFDPLSTALAALIIIAIARFKQHPILYVLMAGLVGALFM